MALGSDQLNCAGTHRVRPGDDGPISEFKKTSSWFCTQPDSMSDGLSTVQHQMKKPRSYADRKQAAFNAGKQAYKDGKKVDECPIQKHQGLQRSWREGWIACEAEREKQTSGMYI